MSGLQIEWLPDAQRVADLLRARTKDDDGNELGAWTDTTRPTLTEVDGFIMMAAGDLLAAVDQLRATYQDPEQAALSLCAKRAAMLIELSYWPEQVATQQSAYAEYKTEWDDGVVKLRSKLAAPPAGGSMYSLRAVSDTVHYAYGYAGQPWIFNLPEPETTLPIFLDVPGPPEREAA